jgi:hypothetical protein
MDGGAHLGQGQLKQTMAGHNNRHVEYTKVNGTGVYLMKRSITTHFQPMKNILLLLGIALLSLAAAVHATAAPPILQFRLVVDNPTADSEQMTNAQSGHQSPFLPEVLNVQREVLLDNSVVKSATVYSGDKTGWQTVIYINFTDDGTKRFAEATRQNIGRRLAVVIDGKLCMAPRINSAIGGGVAQISGVFSKEEAENLAARLNDTPGIIHASQTVFVIRHFYLLCLIAAAVVTLVLIFRKGTPRAG